jgi:hypothetical protein
MIPNIINGYKPPCNSDVCKSLVCKTTGNQDGGKHCNKKTSSIRRKHKIIISGDTHGRDCPPTVIYDLVNVFEVQRNIKARAGLMTITNTSKEEVKNLTKKEVVVVWGGTKEVGGNEATKGLSQLKDFARENNHTNIIQMSVPHRFDLHVNSCVNKEVEVFNRKLSTQMKAFKHTAFIKLDSNGDLFKKHGYHMNKKRQNTSQKGNCSYYKKHVN